MIGLPGFLGFFYLVISLGGRRKDHCGVMQWDNTTSVIGCGEVINTNQDHSINNP
uniref:Uncharacterized protein n=1 Tax=Arundo donax TaxID=35708 RepID=A0A0A8YK02_ARUDO